MMIQRRKPGSKKKDDDMGCSVSNEDDGVETAVPVVFCSELETSTFSPPKGLHVLCEVLETFPPIFCLGR